MATTCAQIQSYFDDAGLKYEVRDGGECILTGFATDQYTNPRGQKGLMVLIELREDGRYIRVSAPMAYRYKEGPHKLAVLQALLMVQWKTKLVQFEYDESDGEIRPVVEFPLEDAPLGREQFQRCVSGLVQIVDHYHPVIQGAIDSGKIEFHEEGGSGLSGALAALAEVLGSMTPEELRQVLEEVRSRTSGRSGPSEL